MRVLVTRPEPDAARIAARLSAAGHEVVVDSLLMIEPVAFDPPRGDYAALAVTSANALRAVGASPAIARFTPLPLFALGAHTADAAREAGFSNIETAGGDADALGAMLARRLPAGARVLYLAGENRARDLAALTAPAKVRIETLVVYRARAAERLRETTVKKLGARELDAVLHFSPRSAEIFVMLARKARLESALSSIRHLCLSDAVAAALSEVGGKVEIASRPEEAALLALLGA
jgi:uroporphyrinogen-III synthase